MKPYLENRKGEKLECKKLTRRENVAYVSKIQEMQKAKDENNIVSLVEHLEDIVTFLLAKSYESLSKADIEDIFDYNEEEYGFDQYLELLMYFATEATSFQKAGGKVHPFLEQKKKEQEEQE